MFHKSVAAALNEKSLSPGSAQTGGLLNTMVIVYRVDYEKLMGTNCTALPHIAGKSVPEYLIIGHIVGSSLKSSLQVFPLSFFDAFRYVYRKRGISNTGS